MPDQRVFPDTPGLLTIEALARRTTTPSAQRWLDIADEPYCDAFHDNDFYRPADSRYCRLNWLPSGQTFTGHLEARGLKPNFAYQVKLVGRAPVPGVNRPPSPEDAEAWASWQLGQSGRWLCRTCGANLLDWDFDTHAGGKHEIVGYVLFDFFVTNARGDAACDLHLDSSYHVLWRTSQRERTKPDGPTHSMAFEREAHGYGPQPVACANRVELFAEHETLRPENGLVKLPPGRYPVLMNITEESFHANQKEEVEHGGYWAEVLESPIEFEITPSRRPIELVLWKIRDSLRKIYRRVIG